MLQMPVCVLLCVLQPDRERLRRSLNMDKLISLFPSSFSQVNITAVNKRPAHAAVKCETAPCLAVNISLTPPPPLEAKRGEEPLTRKTSYFSDIVVRADAINPLRSSEGKTAKTS